MADTEVVPLGVVETSLGQRFQEVRATTASLAARLTPEDQMVQSCPEASPVKWHLAHSTWFFETFILREFVPDYRPFDSDFFWLFNSYYKSLGPHPEKRLRASFSRPSLDQVHSYRHHVEAAVFRLLQEEAPNAALERIELGLHHEQQHQELIVTDIKHAFWTNPLQPAYGPATASAQLEGSDSEHDRPLNWFDYRGGLGEQGHGGNGFSFDNELPQHPVYLQPFRLASRPTTCAEYLAFIEDGGYTRSELWLSDGWDTVQKEHWEAPLYWQHKASRGKATEKDLKDTFGSQWSVYTLYGEVPLPNLLATPVCHLSYYEADAFARWTGCRLPTESEWEHVALSQPIDGHFLEDECWHPQAAPSDTNLHPIGMFGNVWEWTQSPYAGYPGYRPAAGALGEYNGKFMCNQLVLRGGSVATAVSHIRATYRNFFPPATRWQFSGIRLAKDGESA